jgi:hypothetical protein
VLPVHFCDSEKVQRFASGDDHIPYRIILRLIWSVYAK